eukprot:4777179-Lingulodinium_polyedra.AAC.1
MHGGFSFPALRSTVEAIGLPVPPLGPAVWRSGLEHAAPLDEEPLLEAEPEQSEGQLGNEAYPGSKLV